MFTFHHDESISAVFDEGLLLLFGLHGEAIVHSASNLFHLKPSAICAISPLTLYRIECPEHSGFLQLRIPPELLHMAGWTAKTAISCQLASSSNDSAHVELRQRYASLFRLFLQNHISPDLAGHTIGLAAFLREKFPASAKSNIPIDAESIAHLEKALCFIQEHWQEPISLADIASIEFLSESYLSRIFRRSLNQTFTEYIVSVRLDHARRSLLNTRDSVTEIAYACGFKSTNSFIHYFGQYYGTTPGQYRKMEVEMQTADTPTEDISDWISELLQYTTDIPFKSEGSAQPEQKQSASINLAKPGTPINHPWQRLVNIGYARDGLSGEVQAQLRRAKQEIGFTDIRFHGIFDDDMHIYQQKPDGSPWYNFTYVDLLFDFILSIGLTPFVEFSFVPSKLAKEPYRLFERCSMASMYCDRMKWEALVQATVAHWIFRYGLETVVNWRFSCFSLNYAAIQEIPITYEEYLEMYLATYHVLKELDPRLRLGGPGCFTNVMLAEEYGRRFLQETVALGCAPDFLTAQCYPHENTVQDSDFLYFTANQQSTPSVLSEDIDFTLHFLQDFHALAAQCGLEDREIILEEWSSTLWQRDLASDTCYRSAWMVKNALQCCNQAEMLGYWQLTDLMDEWLVPGGIFHGGYGLFSANGIPKAAYRAMRLLARVGTEKIDAGKTWFISRSENMIQIFLFHYCHYDALYRYRYQKLKNPHDAYKVFETCGTLHLSLSLTGLQPGSYRWERRIINRTTGSAFDKWVEIGAPDIMRPDDLKYLADTSQPAYEVFECNCDGTMQIESHLEPHEVQIVVLQKRDC